MNKNITGFFFEYYEKNNIYDVYSQVYYTQDQKTIINSSYSESKNLILVNSVMFIPDYITPKVNSSLFNVLKVNQFFKGYAIFLDKFKI